MPSFGTVGRSPNTGSIPTSGKVIAASENAVGSAIAPWIVNIIKVVLGGLAVLAAIVVTFLPDAAAIAVTAAGAPELAPAAEAIARGHPARGIRAAQRIQTHAAASYAGTQRAARSHHLREERKARFEEVEREVRFTGQPPSKERQQWARTGKAPPTRPLAGLGAAQAPVKPTVSPRDIPLTIEEQTRRANEARARREAGEPVPAPIGKIRAARERSQSTLDALRQRAALYTPTEPRRVTEPLPTPPEPTAPDIAPRAPGIVPGSLGVVRAPRPERTDMPAGDIEALAQQLGFLGARSQEGREIGTSLPKQAPTPTTPPAPRVAPSMGPTGQPPTPSELAAQQNQLARFERDARRYAGLRRSAEREGFERNAALFRDMEQEARDAAAGIRAIWQAFGIEG